MKIVADIYVLGKEFTTKEMIYDSVAEASDECSKLIHFDGRDINSFRQELENDEFLVLAEDSIKSAIFRFRSVTDEKD